MSMAVVCAHLNLLGPSVVATEAKSCSSCNVASPSASFLFRPQRTTGARSAYRPLVCRASAGGQRKDNDKRSKRKDATPSKPDPNLDEKLNAINDDTEYSYEDENDLEGEDEQDSEQVRIPLPADEAAALDPKIARASYVGDKYEASEEKGLGDRAAETGKRVGDNVEEIREEGQESAQAIQESASETADASGKRLQKAGRRVGQSLDDARRAGQAGETDLAVDNVQEGVEEAGKTAQDLAGIAQENAEDAGKRLREAGSSIGEDLQNVGKEGQNVLERGAGAVTKQAREASRELGQQVEETEQGAERAVRSGLRRAQQSAERVQEPIERAVNASIDAAAAIGDEVFKLGDSIIEAVEDATGISGPDRPSYRPSLAREKKPETDDSEKPVGGKYRPAGKSVVKRYQGVKEDGDDSEEQGQGDESEDGDYSGLTVLVAGATGATGRLIVQDLVGKGATVRALVRNVYRARNLKQLQGADLIEGDLYNYESVKEAVSGCDTVISAVGARGLPFDPLQAYRTEYEGVLNLISAAKNQEVKKFVLITTIGVNFLQVIPLLYWKRQTELFLQRSGLDYTIVRPAGLTGDRGSDRVELRPADSLFIGGISRKKVAEVSITALVTPSATDKIVEVVGGSGRVRRSIADQFDSI